MESNRDEALKCLRLAEKYLAEENELKAERFAQKSMNMFPNERAKGQCTRSVVVSPTQKRYNFYLRATPAWDIKWAQTNQ